MIGKWSQYVEIPASNRTKLHFFPNPTGGEMSLCTKAVLSMIERKGKFSDPKNYHERKTCKHCVRIINYVEKIYPEQLKTEAPKETWFTIQPRWRDKPISHFFIKDITKTLCGSQIDLTTDARAEIKFAPAQKEFKNKCKQCENQIEYYLKNGKTRTEIKAEKSHAGYEIYIPPNTNIKPFKISNSPLVWIEVRCTHIEKNGKQCIETGVYPTGDPEKAKDNPHFCLKHNLRVKEAMAT